MPRIATTNIEIENCFDVMSELRTNLIKEDFVSTIRSMEKEGYKLAYIKDENRVVTVSGYRISTNLFMGKHLYIDDLVTSRSVRSRGFGNIMINWLRDTAKQNACNFYHLDSGTHRTHAHKFYMNQEFVIASFHFSQDISKN